MACNGQREKQLGSNCGKPVYRCNKCSVVGCEGEGCTNQRFRYGRCLSCGQSGKRQI